MKRDYRKAIGWLLALILALPFAVETVEGQTTQQQPSAKVTAKTSQFTLIPPTTGTGGWVTILSNNIKTAEMKDLFVTAALEAGVYTQTAVTGTGTSTARGKLEVRILVDGQEIEPGPATYADRVQTLSAFLMPTEMIELMLRTMHAASFSFVGIDIPVGVHNVAVQARVSTEGSATFGTFSALGSVGKGTMTVESVRLIKGEDVPLVP